MFYVLSPLDGRDRLVYTFKDGESISPISQDKIDEMLGSGLTTLSESKREEYMNILSNDNTKSSNKARDFGTDIRNMALSPEVMKIMYEASRVFNEFSKYTEEKGGCDWVHD